MKSFVRWLHEVCLEDTDRVRSFSGIYPLGPHIEAAIGIDGTFDLAKIVGYLRERLGDDAADAHMSGLVTAEATWRTETSGAVIAASSLPEKAAPTICTHVGLDGRSCKNPPVPGSDRCLDHGGAILDPAIRRSVLITSYARMIEASDIAVETLVDVAENSRSALARVAAAREILDRVGLVNEGGPHQTTTTDDSEDQDVLMDALKNRMASARERLQIVAIPVITVDKDESAPDHDIVDAEEIVLEVEDDDYDDDADSEDDDE